MSNLVFQRFKGGMVQNVVKPLDTSLPNDEAAAPPPLAPAVSPEKLRERLVEALMPQPKISLDIEKFGIELVHFANLFEFVHWYENNSTAFDERQRTPLNTLIEARNITLGGCNCDTEKRKFIAEDYFKKFWTQNKSTDLLPTLQKTLQTKKVLFGDFLSFPE